MRARRGQRWHLPHEVLVTLSVLLTLFFVASSSFAQAPPPSGVTPTKGTPLFGLRPGLYGRTTLEKGHYQYAVNPGATVDDTVEVLNLTNEPMTLKLYGADLDQKQSAVSAAQATDEQKGVGKWLVLDRTEINLGPRDTTKIPFQLSVPTDVRPGDHLGAVVASTMTGERQPGSFAVESRVGLMVRVRIPGEAILDAELGPLEAASAGGDRRFTVEVRNTGTLLFNVAGKIDIKSGSESVVTLDVQPKDIYVIPDGRATFEAVWTGTPLFGRRTAQAVLELTADEEPTKTANSNTLTLSFFSWLTILLIALALAALVVWLILRRRRQLSVDEPVTRVHVPVT